LCKLALHNTEARVTGQFAGTFVPTIGRRLGFLEINQNGSDGTIDPSFGKEIVIDDRFRIPSGGARFLPDDRRTVIGHTGISTVVYSTAYWHKVGHRHPPFLLLFRELLWSLFENILFSILKKSVPAYPNLEHVVFNTYLGIAATLTFW
jgi:hypothetical protein